MTTFRADVTDQQIEEIYLPPPERLTRPEAFTLASWAVTHGVPAEDDPSAPARIKEMFGFRAAQHLQQLNKHLADRIGQHVALASKHSLIVELDHDAEGQFFHVVRRRAKAPELYIRHASAMQLLECMGLLSPVPNERRDVELVGRAVARSQAACIDVCMGHYHQRLETLIAFARANRSTTISWETIEVD